MIIHGIEPHRVGAAVFDLGGVIFTGGPAALVEFGRRHGIDEDRWRDLRGELFSNDGPWARVERGELSLEEFVTALRDRIDGAGVSLTVEQARTFLGPADLGDHDRVRPEIVAAIRRIHTRLPTALLTNNVAEWRSGWQRAVDVGDLFDVVIDSSAHGTRKPEPAIYELTQSRLGVDHDRIFFVDDIGQNLKAARTLGWQTLKYERTEIVLEVLDALADGAPASR